MSSQNYPTSELAIPYSSHSSLNTLDIYTTQNSNPTNNSRKYWIVYIHGGGWRDPLNTSSAIIPTLAHLRPTLPIAKIASINYRLSPYRSHPTHPSAPDDVSRNVTHPTHLNDVLDAIRWLQNERSMEHYILTGHSAGGTLTMQVVMEQLDKKEGLRMPLAVVPLAGVYDIRLFRDTHIQDPLYQETAEGAFGKDETAWDAIGPVSGDYRRNWPSGGVIILASSPEDELVDWVQVEAMETRLKTIKDDKWKMEVLKLKGKHDQMWQEGFEVARAITYTFDKLDDKN